MDNSFSAGMDLAGLFPKYINIRRGAYIALVISIAMCPWELLASAGTFISVMSAYSVFLGPMCGIQICDYWIVRSKRLKLADMYDPHTDGFYWFYHGYNWRSFAAWVIGFAPQLPGFVASVNPSVSVPVGSMRMYYLAFPLGFAISFMFYWGFCLIWPPAGVGITDDVDYFGTFTPSEASKLGLSDTIVTESFELDHESQEVEKQMRMTGPGKNAD